MNIIKFLQKLIIKSNSSKIFEIPILQIEPTLTCYFNCRHCFRTQAKYEKSLDINIIQNNIFNKNIIIKELKIGGAGDCFTLPDIIPIFKKLKIISKNISCITHAITLEKFIPEIMSGNLIQKFSVSFEGITEESYNRIRGKNNFQKVINNLKLIQTEKTKNKIDEPEIEAIYTCLKSNVNDIKTTPSFFRNLGFSRIIYQPLIPDDELVKKHPEKLCCSAEMISYSNDEIRKIFQNIKEEGSKLNIEIIVNDNIINAPIQKTNPVSAKKYCDMCLNFIHINFEGYVYPCCLGNGSLILGNVCENSLIDILNSKKYLEIKRNLENNNPYEICVKCREYKNISGKNFSRTS
ncbi:MAG TPA: SPASM domain-containing protein [bacterium]|nr:SPASM domain-containing protein [bacterium]HPN31715.1 SPASM domain-containing protein [bacterium]